jgi:hypothetical protein
MLPIPFKMVEKVAAGAMYRARSPFCGWGIGPFPGASLTRGVRGNWPVPLLFWLD